MKEDIKNLEIILDNYIGDIGDDKIGFIRGMYCCTCLKDWLLDKISIEDFKHGYIKYLEKIHKGFL